MNLIFRLIRIVIAALLRPRLDLLDTSDVTMRVWPNDLDLNLHMNNGRYFTVMDLGRIDLMIRTGVVRWMWRQKWTPVVGSETMRFKRALKPFQAYRLKTRVLCWDERWVFLEQRFETMGGELVALGIVKAVLTAERRTMRPKEALKIMGMLRRSPAMPPAVKAWALAEEWMVEPRGSPPPELEELTEAAVPELRSHRPPRAHRLPSPGPVASAPGASGPPNPKRSHSLRCRSRSPKCPSPAQQEKPMEAPEPPPGRFTQWRRRRAS